ncbi:rhomboid family intramembrane serine protease [Geoalkalibacter halelectricus]|uniref:rhomboid family intramembrane serine protease n=1 Tax=Geoalkalibacter halelectricus TaxID=2847045 RepID=UPI003D21F12D
MFFPLGDTPNFPQKPYLTYCLIALNLGVFFLVLLPLAYTHPAPDSDLLARYLQSLNLTAQETAHILPQITRYDLLIHQYGFRPADPQLLTLFTSLFLHSGWGHILGNLLFLWIFGDNVEHRLGRIRYALLYFGTGIIGTFFFMQFVPGSQTPLIGASGAISGVLGYYFYTFSKNRVRVLVFLFPFVVNVFLIPSRILLGFYLVIGNILPFLVSVGATSGMAFGAHIGGFLAGLSFAWLGNRLTL